MKRQFVYDTEVEAVLSKSGVSDDQVRNMEYAIMSGGGDVISGTGGLRKIRCGARGRGKRGGVRLVFADYPAVGRTYLVAALEKGDRASFSKRERNSLRKFKQVLDRSVRS